MTYWATRSTARSSCSLVSKCSYIPPGATPSTQGWNVELFNAIGLAELAGNGFKQLGGQLGSEGMVLTAGLPVGSGLCKEAAEALGLREGTPVGSAVIDA